MNDAAKRQARKFGRVSGDEGNCRMLFSGHKIPLAQLTIRSQFSWRRQGMTSFVVGTSHTFVVSEPEFFPEVAANRNKAVQSEIIS